MDICQDVQLLNAHIPGEREPFYLSIVQSELVKLRGVVSGLKMEQDRLARQVQMLFSLHRETDLDAPQPQRVNLYDHERLKTTEEIVTDPSYLDLQHQLRELKDTQESADSTSAAVAFELRQMIDHLRVDMQGVINMQRVASVHSKETGTTSLRSYRPKRHLMKRKQCVEATDPDDGYSTASHPAAPEMQDAQRDQKSGVTTEVDIPGAASGIGSSLMSFSKAVSITGFRQQAYQWRDSLWDVSIFIGLEQLTIGSSVAVMFCLVFNLFLSVSLVIQCGSSMTHNNFDEFSRHDFEYWRTTFAHDVELRNPVSGESLARGVCDTHLYIPFANLQLQTVVVLQEYLKKNSFAGIENGKLMCMLVLMIWTCTLTVELRLIVDLMIAFMGLPITSRSGINDRVQTLELISISRFRLFFMFFNLTARLTLLAFIGYFGTMFLMFETDLTEMILNAVALALILNMDEMLFYAILPKNPQSLITKLVPLKYHKDYKNWNAYGELAACMLAFIGFYIILLHWLNEFVDEIHGNLDALCGGVEGSLDFVMAVDAIGIPWAAATPSSGNLSETYSQYAVLQVKKEGFLGEQLPPDKRYNLGLFMQVSTGEILQRYTATLDEFQHPEDWAVIDTRSMDEAVGWNELYVLRDEDFADAPGTVYNWYLWYLLGLPTSGAQKRLVNCSDVSAFRCYQHGSTGLDVVYRKLCPGRCGCDSPTSGTVSSPVSKDSARGFAGCTHFNFQRRGFVEELEELPCEDTDSLATFEHWTRGIGKHPKENLTKDLMETFEAGGCSQVVWLPLGSLKLSKRNLCSESSLPAICPGSCGCNASLDWNTAHTDAIDFCPYTCGKKNAKCRTIKVNHSDFETYTYGPMVGFACTFPFRYKGKTYNRCTLDDWDVPWCPVTLTADGISLHWGDCSPACENDSS